MRTAENRCLALALAILALAAGPLAAASSVAPAATEAAASPYTDVLVADFERVSGQLIDLAEAVPADKYSWRPADGVRTVGEVYMHIAFTNFHLPMGLGAAPPEGMSPPQDPWAAMQEWEKSVTAKDEVIARLRDSIAYAKQAIPQIQDLDTEVSLFGFPASKRAYLLIAVTHAHEHLGQSIAYARSVGVVPPWSAATEETAQESPAADETPAANEAPAEAEGEAEGVER